MRDCRKNVQGVLRGRVGKITCGALVSSFLSLLDASATAEVLHELAALMPGRREELEQAAGSCPEPESWQPMHMESGRSNTSTISARDLRRTIEGDLRA